MSNYESNEDVTWGVEQALNAANKVLDAMDNINYYLDNNEIKKAQNKLADLREESNSIGCKCDILEEDIKKLETNICKEKNCTEDFIKNRDAEIGHLKEDLKKYSGIFPKVKSPVQKQIIKNEINKLQAQEVPKPDMNKIKTMELDLKNKREQLSKIYPIYQKSIKDFEKAQKSLNNIDRNIKAMDLTKNMLHVSNKHHR